MPVPFRPVLTRPPDAGGSSTKTACARRASVSTRCFPVRLPVSSSQVKSKTTGRFGVSTSRGAGPYYFNGERAVGLHIENARPVRSVAFDAPGALAQRTEWMDGVGMAQNDDRLFARIAERSYSQMFSVVFAGNALNGCDWLIPVAAAAKKRDDGLASSGVARWRFCFNQGARKRNDCLLTAEEVINQCMCCLKWRVPCVGV